MCKLSCMQNCMYSNIKLIKFLMSLKIYIERYMVNFIYRLYFLDHKFLFYGYSHSFWLNIYMNSLLHAWTHASIHACMYVYMFFCLYVRVLTCLHICCFIAIWMYVSKHVYKLACMHAYMYSCICVQIHTKIKSK